MNLADVREVRAHLRQEIGGRLRIAVAGIAGDRTQRRRPRVVVEDEMIVGEIVVTQRGIVAAGHAKDGRAAGPSPDQHGGELVACACRFSPRRERRSCRTPGRPAAAGERPGTSRALAQLREVRRGADGIELVFGALSLLAQEELSWPDELLPRLGRYRRPDRRRRCSEA